MTSKMKPEKHAVLDKLVNQTPHLWRAGARQTEQTKNKLGLDTGFLALNTLLKTRGWPVNSVIEIQVDQWGQGELQILLPLMARLSQQQQQLAWIAPPYIPYAPALQAAGIDLNYLLIIEQSEASDAAWAAEKCLRHAAAALVLFCLPKIDIRSIRRLQIAADTGGSLGVLLHCGKIRQTPVSLRIKTRYVEQGLCVQILKSRFGLEQGNQVVLPYQDLSLEQQRI